MPVCVWCGGRRPAAWQSLGCAGPYEYPTGFPQIKTLDQLCVVLEELVPTSIMGKCVSRIAWVLCTVTRQEPVPPQNVTTFPQLREMVALFDGTFAPLLVSYACRILYRMERPVALYVWLNRCTLGIRDEILDTMAYGSETSVQVSRVELFSGRRRITDATIKMLDQSPVGTVFELDSIMSCSYSRDIGLEICFQRGVLLRIDISNLTKFDTVSLSPYIFDMSLPKASLVPETDYYPNRDEIDFINGEAEVIIRPGVLLKLLGRNVSLESREIGNGSVDEFQCIEFHVKLETTEPLGHTPYVHLGRNWDSPHFCVDFIT
jgi:hypothetical protein